MYIIIETIPQNGSDLVTIEISKGDSMFYDTFADSIIIYVKQTWKDVYLYLKKFDITIVEPSGNNIHIDYFITTKENIIKQW